MSKQSDAHIDRLEAFAWKAFRRLIAAVEAAGESRTEATACFMSECMNACASRGAKASLPDALRRAAYVVEGKIAAANETMTAEDIRGTLEWMEAQGLVESKIGPDGQKLVRMTEAGTAQKAKREQD